MVANTHENGNSKPSRTAMDKRAAVSAKSTRLGSSSTPKASTTPMSCTIRAGYSPGHGLEANSIKKQYEPYINKGKQYCSKMKMDPFSTSVETGVNFLAELYHTGEGYSAINTARRALSTCLLNDRCKSFGSHPLVSRFIKGVFESRPALPKYSETWDVKQVLSYLQPLHPPESLTLKDLTHKLVMLLPLLSRQKCQTLHSLSVSDMKLTPDKCVFVIKALLKTSRPGRHISSSSTRSSVGCCYLMLEYVKRTSALRQGARQLLLSYKKPYKPVSADTVSNWIKHVLRESGINTSPFSAHSTRSASTSSARPAQIPLDTIMRSAGWSNYDSFPKIPCCQPKYLWQRAFEIL